MAFNVLVSTTNDNDSFFGWKYLHQLVSAYLIVLIEDRAAEFDSLNTAEPSCLQRLEWTSRPAESTMACMLLACKTSNCTIVKPPQPFCDIMGPYGQLTRQTPSLGFESSTVIFILMSVHVIWEVELNSSLHY